MNLIKAIQLFVIVTTTVAAHERHLAEDATHRCGARPPTESDEKAREYAEEFSSFLAERNPELLVAGIQVPVCFHIPRRFLLGGERISDEQLQNELDQLNRAYSAASCCDSSISQYHVRHGKLGANGDVNGVASSVSSPGACVTRPRQRRWTRSRGPGTDVGMKSALHKGDERLLNIYYTNLSGGILGYATFPFDYDSNPDEDGVVMSRNAIVGAAAPYDEGDTLAHEVGHWLGLFHTFEGGCSPGDGIADTAPEKTANFGCTPGANRDTCPGDGKLDPIFNFMDYSDDKCLFEFTAGQVSTMVSSYLTYRSPGRRLARMLKPIQEGLHEMGSLDAGATRVFEMSNVPMESLVTCHVTHNDEDGDLDLFMNSHGHFSDFECTSESRDEHESCSLMVTSDKVYVFVHAMAGVSGFTVDCSVATDASLE